jgi:hypothetical protein
MYHTGTDPFTGQRIFVERDMKRKERQKALLTEGVRTERGGRRRVDRRSRRHPGVKKSKGESNDKA